jgi:hypothetical protein
MKHPNSTNMKKLIAFSAALFFVFSTTAFATPPAKDKKPTGKVKVKPNSTSREPVIGGGAPAPRPEPQPQQQQHGKKKGWNKNPHNPHHPQSDNPGHARR